MSCSTRENLARPASFRLFRLGCCTALGAAVLCGCTGLNIPLGQANDFEAALEPPVHAVTRDLVIEDERERSQRPKPEDVGTGGFAVTVPLQYQYKIGPGDVLHIAAPGLTTFSSLSSEASSVGRLGGESGASFGEQDAAGNNRLGSRGLNLNNEQPENYVVAEDGTVYVPYVGTLKVNGQSITQVQALMTQGMKPFFKEPIVIASVSGYNSQRVLVSGAVPKPGYLPVTNLPMSLVDALTLSGAVSRGNRLSPYPLLLSSSTQQILQTGSGAAGGLQEIPDLSQVEVRRGTAVSYVDVATMLRKGVLDRNWLLQDGDIVYVPSLAKNYIYLFGQVPQQSLVEITEDKTSLAQVLAIAGGVSQQSANARQIYVVRGGLKNPTIFQLDGEASDALTLADAFILEPRDVIYVSEARISRWNRMLNQIIPSFETTVTGTAISTATGH